MGTICPTRLLNDMIIYCSTSQLNKNLEDEPNKLIHPSKTLLIKPSAIDLKLYNTPKTLKKMYKTLSFLAIPLSKILASRLKWSNKKISLNKKRNLYLTSDNILKICHNKLDFLK